MNFDFKIEKKSTNTKINLLHNLRNNVITSKNKSELNSACKDLNFDLKKFIPDNNNAYNLFGKNDLINPNIQNEVKNNDFPTKNFSKSENNVDDENKFKIELMNKKPNNIKILENLKWFDINVTVPKILSTDLFNTQKIPIKIGVGRILSEKKNSENLDVIIPHDYIDMLAKFNIIEKNINDLNQFKQCALNIMKPLYIEKINLQMQRQWYLNY